MFCFFLKIFSTNLFQLFWIWLKCFTSFLFMILLKVELTHSWILSWLINKLFWRKCKRNRIFFSYRRCIYETMKKVWRIKLAYWLVTLLIFLFIYSSIWFLVFNCRLFKVGSTVLRNLIWFYWINYFIFRIMLNKDFLVLVIYNCFFSFAILCFYRSLLFLESWS